MAPDHSTPEHLPVGEPGSATGDGAKRLSLSRDLGEFLIEFSIALNRTAMYPEGHPSLGEAASAVVNHLSTLLRDRSNLSIGIAREQLVIDGVATDSANPVLRSLANRLHRHHISVITFRSGSTAQEILSALELLAAEQAPGETPLGLGDPARLTVGPNVRLYPMTYERLEMIDDPDPEREGREDSQHRSRLASLWIGLARAALAAEADDEMSPEQVAPTAVARAINEHPATLAYDEVIVGYLLQIAGELNVEGGATGLAVRKHLSRVIDGLNDAALDRLLTMGGDLEQRRTFLLDAVNSMAADTVVSLARSAARAANRTLSEPLLRVLSKLAAVAETGGSRFRTAADAALRDELRELVASWTTEGATPDYAAALDASTRLSTRHASEEGSLDRPDAMRMFQMALELDAHGPPVERALDTLLAGGAAAAVLAMLVEAGPCDGAESAWRQVGERKNIARLLALDSIDDRFLDCALSVADPPDVATELIDAIVAGRITATHVNARTAMRRHGPQIGEEAGHRLTGEPTVRRILLGFLSEHEMVPPGVSPLALSSDPDPQVRREALRLAFLLPAERERAIEASITDPDERVVRVGLRAVESDTPRAVIPLLAGRAGDPGLPMDLRTVIVRALGTDRSPPTRDALLRVATSGRTIFGRPRLAPRSPEMLAGLAGLAESWADDPKVSRLLRRARTSSDPPTRAAVRSTR